MPIWLGIRSFYAKNIPQHCWRIALAKSAVIQNQIFCAFASASFSALR